MVKERGRVLLAASYSAIEPLGILHLGGLARNKGWAREYHLVKNHDYEEFHRRVDEIKPDVVGFNIYTGNHLQLFEAFERLKKDHPNIRTVIGGPHATYFPQDVQRHTDFVVMQEGFDAFSKILDGSAEPGILTMDKVTTFPHPDRATFYAYSPEHGLSPIKSFISMTGCPYKCTYCYNSSDPEDIKAPQEVIERVGRGIALNVLGTKQKEVGKKGRLFPFNVRTVDDVIAELKELQEQWPTELVYCQDDVHGFDIKDWLPEFARRMPQEVGLAYHAQMRWEMTRDERRLDLVRSAGCTGLTLAIEAADPVIRHEVLDRDMPEEDMFKGMKAIVDRGMTVRTEQITALPYGATSQQTAMNLDADLELLALNVRLRRETGGPTIAWASTFVPYAGTKLGTYASEHGFYQHPDNHDIKDTFFEGSVMRFPQEWIGPSLKEKQHDSNVWLSETDLGIYREQNAELRRNFNFFALIPDGDVLARNYLTSGLPFSMERLGKEAEAHIRARSGEDSSAAAIASRIDETRAFIASRDENSILNGELTLLVPLIATLPEGVKLIDRLERYAVAEGSLTPKVISTATRHHIYDEALYRVNASGKRSQVQERYPPKV